MWRHKLLVICLAMTIPLVFTVGIYAAASLMSWATGHWPNPEVAFMSMVLVFVGGAYAAYEWARARWP